MNWESATKFLVGFPKTKPEEGMIGDLTHRNIAKRRTSHQSTTEHELEVRPLFLCIRKIDFSKSKREGAKKRF